MDADDLDYRIGEDQSIPEKPETFDLILSTRCSSTCPEPQLYLAECIACCAAVDASS